MAFEVPDLPFPDEFLDDWFDDGFLDAPFQMARESPYEDDFLDGATAASREPGVRRRRGAAFCQLLADMANEIMDNPAAYEAARLNQRPEEYLQQEEIYAPVSSPLESDMVLDDVESNDSRPVSVRVPASSSTAPTGPFAVSVALISGERILHDVELQLDSSVAHLYAQAECSMGGRLQALVGPCGNHLDKRDLVKLSGLRSGDVITALAESSVHICATDAAFAAIHADGTVVTWGAAAYGGDSGSVQRQLAEGDVISIHSSERAFAALKQGGAVVTWGDSFYGGDSGSVKQQLSRDVQGIYSTASAFAALKRDGSLVSWGDLGSQIFVEQSDVKQVYANKSAFAAIRRDGSVVTWGDEDQGGDSSAVEDELSSGVLRISSTDAAFAAVKSDGSVTTWGSAAFGGDSSAVQQKLQSGIRQIYSNMAAFAAVASDGSVVTWGQPPGGGDSSHVRAQLRANVRCVFATRSAFAALKEDGSVVPWGFSECGGSGCSLRESVVEVPGIKAADVEVVDVHGELKRDVVQIYATDAAFAAVKSDGSLVAWGKSASGGDCTMVQKQLLSGVRHVTSTSHAFAALKRNGSVVAWGGRNHGGDGSVVQGQLTSGVQHICATGHAFAAVKSTGSVITWGNTAKGGADMPGASGGTARTTTLTTVSSRRSKWAATAPEESHAESFDADFMRQVKEVPAAADLVTRQPNPGRQNSMPTLHETGRRLPSNDAGLPAAPAAQTLCSFGAWPSDENEVCSFGAWPGAAGGFGGQAPEHEQVPSPGRAGGTSVQCAGHSSTLDNLLEEEDAEDASAASIQGFDLTDALDMPPVHLEGAQRQQYQLQNGSGRKSGRSSSTAASPKRSLASPARSFSSSPQKKVDPAELQKQSDAFWENMAATLQAGQDGTAAITRNTSMRKAAGTAGLTQTGMFGTKSSASTAGNRRPPRIR